MTSFERGIVGGMEKVALSPHTMGTAAGLRVAQEAKKRGLKLSKITNKQYRNLLDTMPKKLDIYSRVIDKLPAKKLMEASGAGAGVLSSQGLPPGKWWGAGDY